MPDKVRKFIYEMQYNFVILQHQKQSHRMQVISPIDLNRLNEAILASSRTAIVTHMKPDGDAAGSVRRSG
jgi:hypothetical protein